MQKGLGEGGNTAPGVKYADQTHRKKKTEPAVRGKTIRFGGQGVWRDRRRGFWGKAMAQSSRPFKSAKNFRDGFRPGNTVGC